MTVSNSMAANMPTKPSPAHWKQAKAADEILPSIVYLQIWPKRCAQNSPRLCCRETDSCRCNRRWRILREEVKHAELDLRSSTQKGKRDGKSHLACKHEDQNVGSEAKVHLDVLDLARNRHIVRLGTSHVLNQLAILAIFLLSS